MVVSLACIAGSQSFDDRWPANTGSQHTIEGRTGKPMDFSYALDVPRVILQTHFSRFQAMNHSGPQ